MKNDLTCSVVGDLLPSYVDGLTSDETNAAIEYHLETCASCQKTLETMRANNDCGKAEVKEIDYLKQVRRKNKRRMLIAIFCTVLVILGGLGAKLYLIGEPEQLENMTWMISTSNNGNLKVKAESLREDTAYFDWEFKLEGKTAQINTKKVRPSFLHNSREWNWAIGASVAKDVTEIYLCGELIWADGVAVHSETRALYEAQTLYVGDNSALGEIANILHIYQELGEHTMELKTDKKPYRWTLHFSEDGWQGVFAQGKETVIALYAPMMLALVENLDEIGWSYTDKQGRPHSGVITLEEVNAQLPELVEEYNTLYHTDWTAKENVKDYAVSVAELEKLSRLLNLT